MESQNSERGEQRAAELGMAALEGPRRTWTADGKTVVCEGGRVGKPRGTEAQDGTRGSRHQMWTDLLVDGEDTSVRPPTSETTPSPQRQHLSSATYPVASSWSVLDC